MKNRIVSRLSKDTIRFLDFIDFMGYLWLNGRKIQKVNTNQK